jgi:hypothetical protein
MTSHGTGIAVLVILSPLAFGKPLYITGLAVAAILAIVALWEEISIRVTRGRRGLDPNVGAEEKISMVET